MKLWLIRTCAFLFIIQAAAGAFAEVPELGPNETIVFEPVFRGEVLIYESGKQHSQSVVLVHGLGDNGARDWELLIPELDAYHVVAFDLPGFGRSAKLNVKYSPTMYAAFVKWVVDTYVDDEFALIGHSMGGAVALRFAATFPRNLDHLILVDVAGVLHEIALSKYVVDQAMIQYLPAAFNSKARRLIRRATSYTIEKLENQPIDVGIASGSTGPRDVILRGSPAAIAALGMAEEDFSRLLDCIEVPTLLLWGSEDTVAPLRTGKVLEKRLPNARLVLIPEAEHVPMLQKPEVFNRLLLTELDTRPSHVAAEVTEVQPSNRIGRCKKEKGVVFTGSYDSIEIVDCSEVQLLDVTARTISVTDSEVDIEGSRILGDAFGLVVLDSFVNATTTLIQGDTAVHVSNSRLDFAGVELIGREAALVVETDSSLVASVSKVTSPYTGGPLHGYWNFEDGDWK